MKNAMLILAGFSVVTSALAVDACRADDVDWVLGQWVGYIQSWKADKSGRDIGARVLTVSRTGSSAAPAVAWYAPAANPVSVNATIASSGLTFDHEGAAVSLHSDGDANLAGTYVGPLGKRFGLTLAHPKTITDADGTWSGTASADDPNCFPGRVNLSISNGQLSGTVHYIPANPIEGPGKIEHTSDISGEVWSDGVVFLRLKKHAAHGRNSWFHGRIEDDQINADDPGYSEGDCSFRMTLKRLSP
jgi:hypothetical protein